MLPKTQRTCTFSRFLLLEMSKKHTLTSTMVKSGSLEEAVRIMGDIQLGLQLRDNEVKAIVAFLKSLTGEIPKYVLTLSVLPASTKDTTKPSLD